MEIMFINLSPFKYSNILNAPNSPLKKIELLKFSNSLNQNYYEAHAWLKDNLRPNNIDISRLYGTCDSTGTDKYSNIAIWKCISESMERWAFYTLLQINSKKFGMSIDRTTTGFSALPCWPKICVRSFAYGEAIERWAISNWWREKITGEIISSHINNDYGFAQINIGNLKGCVIISFKLCKSKSAKRMFYSYGFAFGKNVSLALKKAQVEMDRNQRVLSVNLDAFSNSINDQRLKYFSTQEGFEHFRSKFIKNKTPQKIFKYPELIVDEEVPGPWTNFVTVWRCLFDDTDYCWNDPKHFMF